MQLQVVGGRARARTGRAPAWPCSPWTSRTLSPLNRHLLPGHPHPFTSKRSDRLNTRRSMASTKVRAALGGILSSEQATDAPPPRISPRRRPAPPSLAFPLVRARPLLATACCWIVAFVFRLSSLLLVHCTGNLPQGVQARRRRRRRCVPGPLSRPRSRPDELERLRLYHPADIQRFCPPGVGKSALSASAHPAYRASRPPSSPGQPY
jgi:hypothetical protein